MEEIRKKNSKAMEAKEGSAAHSRSFGFYNGRGPKKIQTKQPASHAGDPCARQTANGNSGFDYTDASISCTAMACDVALQPQSMELASLTGGSQSAKDVAIWTGDLASACTYRHWCWRFAQGHQTRHWFWRFGSCMHGFHVNNCPMLEII